MAAPAQYRPSLFVIFAFNLETARAPWMSQETMIAEMRLQWWHDALEEIATGGTGRRHEVLSPLAKLLTLTAPCAAAFSCRPAMGYLQRSLLPANLNLNPTWRQHPPHCSLLPRGCSEHVTKKSCIILAMRQALLGFFLRFQIVQRGASTYFRPLRTRCALRHKRD